MTETNQRNDKVTAMWTTELMQIHKSLFHHIFIFDLILKSSKHYYKDKDSPMLLFNLNPNWLELGWVFNFLILRPIHLFKYSALKTNHLHAFRFKFNSNSWQWAHLDADGKAPALPEHILADVFNSWYRNGYGQRHGQRHGQRRGGGSADGDRAVTDVLTGRAVDLSVGRLDGCRQGFHAVNALGGIAEAGVEGRLAPRPGTVHVSILRRLCAALGRDGDEGLGGGARRYWRRSLFVGCDTWWHCRRKN